MRTQKNDPLLLFYLPSQEQTETTFDALVLIYDTISKAKGAKQARSSLRALLDTEQPEQTKEFINRIIDLHKDRMERYAQAALRRLFAHTEHYQSALNNRAAKARVNRSRLSNFERGYSQPTEEELKRLASALKHLIDAKAAVQKTAVAVGWPLGEVR